MRRLAFALIAGAASAACPAFAQQQPGGPPPGGGAPPTEVRVDNRGMGSIDDIPQQSRDPRTAAENALARRGDVRADLTANGRSREAAQALAYREAIDRYVGKSNPRRLEALGAAEAVKAGSTLPDDAKAIRSALDKDLAAWRDAFGFDKATYQDQRDQWLTERTPMTASDWARRRAEWFAARDAWIEGQKVWAAEQAAAK